MAHLTSLFDNAYTQYIVHSGETTEEDMEDAKQYERNQYIEKKRAKEEREAALRQYRPRNKSGQAVTETFEVVE